MSIPEQMNRMPETNTLTLEWIAAIRSSEDGGRSLAEVQAIMDRSTAICHGQPVPCSAVPRLFSTTEKFRMQYACETMHRILKKIIERYCADPAFRTLFPFDPRAENLIIDSWDKRTSLPFARYDVFLDERTGSFTFCELNADGSSGMNEDREIARALRTTAAFEQLSQTHRLEPNELIESWIDTFIDLADLATSSAPLVAICDYRENAMLAEFEVYRKHFKNRGIACEICDVRSLMVKDDALRLPNGRRIDAVWRRCVSSDLLAHWDESQALIRAMCTGLACVLGDFSGAIAHDKRIFSVLHSPRAQEIITEGERAFVAQHVPYTTPLDGNHIDAARLKDEKDLWVIKPADGYGAKDVHLGIDCIDEHWSALVDAHIGNACGRPFVAQRFHAPYRSLAAPLSENAEKTTADFKPYANLSGLYAYDGHFAGTYSRLGPGNIVSGLFGGLSAATFWIDCARPDPRMQASPSSVGREMRS